MERYDWPLLAILVVVTLSILLVLRALRSAICVLTALWLRLRILRQGGAPESRAGIGMEPAATK
jgi:hypothetical protein